jgi:hypothetical protein
LNNPRRDLIAPLEIFVIDMNASPQDNSVRSTHGVLGDIISSANGKAISSADEFRQLLASFKPGNAGVLRVEHQSLMMYVPFEME